LVRASDDPRVFVRDVSEDDAVLRHIVDLESFAAWRFTIADIAIDDAVVAATRVGPAWPRAPFVLSVGGGPAVSVLDVDVDRPAPGNDDVDNDGAPGDGDDGAPDTDDSGDDTAPTDHDDRAERIIEVVPTSSCAAGAAPDAWLCFALALLARRRRGRRGRPMPRRSCG
jgi:hypothetical protein